MNWRAARWLPAFVHCVAISYCKFNVTPKNVLDKERDLLDKNTDGYLDIPSISQFICDDQEDDTDLLSRDLRGYIEIDESEK